MLSCLVFGGGGFIGGHLVRMLLERNDRIITVVGRSANPRCNLPSGVKYIQLAHDSPLDRLRGLMDGVDEIVDLAHATVPKTSFDDPVLDVLQNLPFTVSLIKMAAEGGLRRFVFVSSGGTVYGNAHYLPIDESHPTNPVSPYGITKLAAEKYGFMYHALEGLPFIAVRPGNPYGPNQLGKIGQGFIAAVLTAGIEGVPVRIFGERGTVRDYIFIDDLVRGIRDVLDSGIPGAVYNIGSGQGLDNLQVVEEIKRCVAADLLDFSVIHESSRSF
jgi:UDP-glucose 4-epimerase